MDSYSKKHCVSCQTNFGSEDKLGMCNVCYSTFTNSRKKYDKTTQSEHIKKTEDKSTVSVPKEKESEVKEDNSTLTKPQQKNIYACWKCSMKVGYLGFKCKCGYTFCGSCRHFSAHNCDFDYKNYDRLRLQEKNNGSKDK